jgi:ribosomal protein S18 acetylase RimI-like enzyme
VLAQLEHLAEAKRLSDSFKRELGFINRATLQRAIESKSLLVALCSHAELDSHTQNESDPQKAYELAGMVHFYVRRDNVITLYNIAVAPTYQKRGIGRQLFKALIEVAESRGKTLVRLKCPSELSANLFYEHLGLELLFVEPGKLRPLNVWGYKLKDYPQMG